MLRRMVTQTKRATNYHGIFPVHRHLFCTYGYDNEQQEPEEAPCAANVVSHALRDAHYH
jgi:hypothetical protein